jgi:hypothetical protein
MRLCRVERLLSISRPRRTSPLFLISRQKGARLPDRALPRRQAQEVHRGVLRLKFHRHPGEPLREQRIARDAAVAAAATAAGACARSSFSRVSLARARRRRTVARRAEIGRGGRNGRGLVPHTRRARAPHPALTRSASRPRAATTRAVAPARRPTASLTRRSDGAPTTKQTHSHHRKDESVTGGKPKYVTPKTDSVLKSTTNQCLMQLAGEHWGYDVEERPIEVPLRLGLTRTRTHTRARVSKQSAPSRTRRAREEGSRGRLLATTAKRVCAPGVQLKRVERAPRADGGPCCRLCVARDGAGQQSDG